MQKDRYFESLTAKFWNSSAKGTCPNSDDSEGITLESLGKFTFVNYSTSIIYAHMCAYRKDRNETEYYYPGIPFLSF